METILWLYQQPYDQQNPLICFDERPCQLISEVLQPIAMKPTKAQRQHSAYQRKGTCCALVAFEPLKGYRFARVFKQRTKIQYAQFMQDLAQKYPHADKIHIVQDNLSTHTKGAFYQAFPAQKAFELAQKFIFHFTPVRASWLNMVEIELSVLARRCLNRRIGCQKVLAAELEQLIKERNLAKDTVNWQFSITKARDTLNAKYPDFNIV